LSAPRGILAATLTPFDEEFFPDATLAIPYYAELLQSGCDGLNVLGTTGEAMSIGLQSRLRFMELLASALPVGRMTCGTGASALEDAVQLTRLAIDAGFGAALVIPPFYYRDSGERGVLRFFDALFARVHPPRGRIMLYNFPRMSGYEFSPELLARLLSEFPGLICGIKDSSNNMRLEQDWHAAHPELAIYPGSEALLADARRHGFAGCISGSVCLWAAQAKEAWTSGDAAALERVEVLRDALEGMPLIGAVRERVAGARSEPAWTRSMPPLGTPQGALPF